MRSSDAAGVRARLVAVTCGAVQALGSCMLALALLQVGKYACFVLAVRRFVNEQSSFAERVPVAAWPQWLALGAAVTGVMACTWALAARRVQALVRVTFAGTSCALALVAAVVFVWLDAASRILHPYQQLRSVALPQLLLAIGALVLATLMALVVARAQSPDPRELASSASLSFAPLLVVGIALLRHALDLHARETHATAPWDCSASSIVEQLDACRLYVGLSALPPLAASMRARASRWALTGACAWLLVGGSALAAVQPMARDAAAPPAAFGEYNSRDRMPARWLELPASQPCEDFEIGPVFDLSRRTLDGRVVDVAGFEQDLETHRRNWSILHPDRAFVGVINITGAFAAERLVVTDREYLRAARRAGITRVALHAYRWRTVNTQTLGTLRAFRTCAQAHELSVGAATENLNWGTLLQQGRAGIIYIAAE